MRPAPGEKRGAGRERRGAKRAAFWPPVASPPYLSCPQHDRARGAAAAECGRRSQPPPTLSNGMAGACRRARLPTPATRGTAREGTGGAQRNPAAGAQAFAPSHRRQLLKRGRRGRLRRKADECTARRCGRGATGCAHTEDVLTRSAAAQRAATGGSAPTAAASNMHHSCAASYRHAAQKWWPYL